MILKTGQTLIAQTEQLEYEPRVHLVKPMMVSGKTKLSLTPWPEYTDDTDVLLHSDSLLTVCEPSEQVLSAYIKKTGLKEEDLNPPETRVILNEEESVPDPQPPEIDEYEPRYIEEPLY